MESQPPPPLLNEPTKNLVRFEVSAPAPSEIPNDFPPELLEAMPQWQSWLRYHASFDAVFLGPLTEEAIRIQISVRSSSFPPGLGDWGENPKTLLARGRTAPDRLANFIEQVKTVYGQDCNIAFRASK